MDKLDKNSVLELLENWENLVFIIEQTDISPEIFTLLMNIALEDQFAYSWRAAWMVDKINSKYPELILPFFDEIIAKLKKGISQGTKRHFLKLLSLNQLSQKYFGFLVDYCFEALTSAKEPPAIRVHAMQILFNISEIETNLKPELLAVLQHEIEFHSTAGIIARGSKLVKKLERWMLKNT